MDERHWWFTSKIVQTLDIGINDNATLLEDFMAQGETVELLNNFFQPNGEKLIFFYLSKEDVFSSNKTIHTGASSSVNLHKLLNDIHACVYFLRENTENEIMVQNLEHEVFSGEIKQDGLAIYSNVVGNILMPLIGNKRDWGLADVQDFTSFQIELEKLSQTLVEYSNANATTTQILKLPKNVNSLQKNRRVSSNAQVVAEYEHMVTDWIHSIESVLIDSLDDRFDLYISPIAMLFEWKRRQSLIQGIMDQLKSKEIKSVIAVLISAKSKVLKNWKVIDAGLTDAFNDVKDKHKYLDSIRHSLEQLQHESTLFQLSSSVLPDFLSAIRHLDSFSKLYAKNGFLGSLFSKVSNQLTMLCKQNIIKFISNLEIDDEDINNKLWYCINNEIMHGKVKIEKNCLKKKITKDCLDGLLSVLYSCLSVCNQYKNLFYSLIGSLGAASQYTPAINSLNLLSKKLKQASNESTDVTLNDVSSTANMKDNQSDQLCNDNCDTISTTSTSGLVYGVAFSDEKTILHPINLFTQQIHELIDVMETTKQIHKLISTTRMVPQLNKCQLNNTLDQKLKNGNDEDEYDGASLNSVSCEVEVACVSLPKDIHERFKKMTKKLKKNLTLNVFLDFDSSTKGKFDSVYVDFIRSIQEIEYFTEMYLKALFTIHWNTQQALDILSCFSPVLSRTALSPTFQEKYTQVLQCYLLDLESIEKQYNISKKKPPTLRNVPIVSSAIYWAKGLFHKIETPMNTLRNIKLVTSLKQYSNAVKYYNRLATVLLQFEQVWLTAWISQAELCTKSFNRTLLALEVGTNRIIVYADPRILEVFADVKVLQQTDVMIPSNILELCAKERKFKHYKQTLEYLLTQYYSVCDTIPPHLQAIATPLRESTLAYFQPGLLVLTWDSVNIDAFLLKAQNAIDNFKKLVDKATGICHNTIDKSVRIIRECVLFDKSMVFARVWNPSNLLELHKSSVVSVGAALSGLIHSIEVSLQEIATTLMNKNSSTNNNVAPVATEQYAVSLLADGSQTSSSPISFSNNRKSITDLFAHYSAIIFDAVLRCTVLSLKEYHNTINSKIVEPRSLDGVLQFVVNVIFDLPNIALVPKLIEVQTVVSQMAQDIINVSTNIYWWDVVLKKTFHEAVLGNSDVVLLKEKIDRAIVDLDNNINSSLLVFENFNFLWLDDMDTLYSALEEEEPDLESHHAEVRRIVAIEKNIQNIFNRIEIGSIELDTTPIKDSMNGFCKAWKMCYVQKLCHFAKQNLNVIVAQQEIFYSHLTSQISSLLDLNNVLSEIQCISEMENEIEGLYTPVEALYDVLISEYGVPITREEIDTVKSLRDRWDDLVILAKEVGEKLMKEQRTIFEQELDKDVKDFTVKVIRFRNRFDSQGPGIPGIDTSEAVIRLKEFQDEYISLNKKRETLHAVQQLFGSTPTPFDELQKTGEELELLGMLYELFQQFISFDKKFCESLWADVNLEDSHNKMQMMWRNCTHLPTKIHNWFAYRELKDAICNYLEVFPILHQLASKEIRNRHWLQVMRVTKKSFQLEANIFKLAHIMDIGLIEHKTEIEYVVQSSQAELDLENRLRRIEEEWTEQAFKFGKFKGLGIVIFDKLHMNGLLDTLEDAKTSLASMLTSKYIRPLREQTAAWSVKLNDVGEVLEQWIDVEKLWLNLEAVFNSGSVAREIPHQYSNFKTVDRSYMKLMKKSVETANVIECCLGGEVSNMALLRQMYKDLESCFKNLDGYFDEKRKIFPRFNFVSNQVLLSMLSMPYNLDSVLPFLREVISGVHCAETHVESLGVESKYPLVKNQSPSAKRKSSESTSTMNMNRTEKFAIKSDVNNGNRSSLANSFVGNTILSFDTGWIDDISTTYIISVCDAYGEKLILQNRIVLQGQVEVWLVNLLEEIKSTVHERLFTCIENIKNETSIDDLVMNFPCQIALMGLMYYWTMECEKSINEIRVDRNALTYLSKKLTSMVNSFSQALIRRTWKFSSINLTTVQKIRMEAVTGMAMYLRDVFDLLISHKLRNIADFEWKQVIKCYYTQVDEEKFNLQIHMLHNKLDYHNEFLGCKMSLIMSPATERCLVNLGQAVVDQTAGCVSGPALVGKTEIVNGLADLLGQHLFTISSMSTITVQSLQRIFVGVAEDGSWCCFKNFQCFAQQLFPVLHHLTRTILHCLRDGMKSVNLGSVGQVNVINSCRLFFTTSLPHIHRTCPPSFKSMLRNVSLTHPDMLTIVKLQLIAHGFKYAKFLASKIKLCADICKNQLDSEHHFSLLVLKAVVKRGAQKQQAQSRIKLCVDGFLPKMDNTSCSVGTFTQASIVAKGVQKFSSMKDQFSAIPAIISETMKIELGVITQSLDEIIGSRLSDQEHVVFKSVLQSVFGSFGDLVMESQPEDDLQSSIIYVLKEKGLAVHKPFVHKVLKLYQLSQVNHAIIICGPSTSGKSSCLSVLIEALSEMSFRKNTPCSYKHDHVNVLATSNLNSMFGFTNESGDWMDGVVSMLLKKACQHVSARKSLTWITLDGPLHDQWCFQMKTLIANEKVFVQPNLEKNYMNEQVKLCFETDDISNASPTIVSAMGMLFVDNSTVGWRAVAEAWLALRPAQQRHTLQCTFNKIVDRIVVFLQEETEMCVQLSDSALMSSCLNLLSCLLKEGSDLAGDLHIERLFLFALIWVFGGLLVHDVERKQFNTLLLSLTNVLPDDDDGISVFDYYVDEAGEWDTWDTRLCELGNVVDSIDAFGDVYIDTQETVRAKFLLNLFSSSGNSTLLIGSRCTGKSSLVKNYLQKQGEKSHVLKNFAFTNITDATFLQKCIDGSFHHRQGFCYEMKNNKILNLFIDDLHLPRYDLCDQQTVNQLLRQLMDQKMIYASRPCKQKYIERLHVIATMNPYEPVVQSNKQKFSRLLGKFCIIHALPWNEKQIFSITSALLEAKMTCKQGLSLPQALHEQIVNASTELLTEVSGLLNGCYTDMQSHYMFNIADLSRVFLMLQCCPEKLRADEEYLQVFWYHEVKRVFVDKISKKEDIDWFTNTIDKLLQKHFSLHIEDEPLFTTFASDTHVQNERQVGADKPQKKQNISHQRIATVNDVKKCLESFFIRYVNEKNEQLDLTLHDFNSVQLIKTHRMLSFENRGNMVLITSELEQMNNIVKLTTFMLGYHHHIMDCSTSASFCKTLRMVVRMAGCDQKHVTIVVNTLDIKNNDCLEVLHSLMQLGEYAPLFNDTELHSLLVALRPTIKKINSDLLNEPKRFFTNTVKKNLHVVIITSPEEKFLPFLHSNYPSVLSHCCINWLSEDSTNRLMDETRACFSKSPFWNRYDEKLRIKLQGTLQYIHTTSITKTTLSDGAIFDDNVLNQSDILRSKVLSMMKSSNQHRKFNIITFKKFLNCFKYIMQTKVDEFQQKTKKRRFVLDHLSFAEEKNNVIVEEKMALCKEYETLEKETDRFCEELFSKSSLIERLKAKYGIRAGSFPAFMALIDSEMVDSDEELSWDDDYDELDEEYERIQLSSQERLKTLEEQIEDISDLVKTLENEMKIAKQMLDSFQIQIDRGCIERLRAYQSPPTLVGTIMVMLMILLKRPEFLNSSSVPGKSEKKTDGGFVISESSLSRTSSTKSKRPKDKVYHTPDISNDGKVDRNTWKSIQQIMQDSHKFCELMNTYDWCKGIPDDIMNTVVSCFAPGEEIPEIAREESKTSTKSDEKGSGISLQSARYSSADAAQIVEYVQKVIHFTRKYKPYIQTLNQLTKLKVQMEEKERNLLQEKDKEADERLNFLPDEADILESLNKDDIQRLQSELVILQHQFDECSLKKVKLGEKIQEFSNLLDYTVVLLQSIKPMRKSWLELCDNFSDASNIITDGILSAAYTCYCAPVKSDKRIELMREFLSICNSNELPSKLEHPPIEVGLTTFLNKEVDIMTFHLMYPSADQTILDIPCMLHHIECINVWPLLCDPHNVGVYLLMKLCPDITVIRFDEIDSVMEQALQQGSHVIVTNVQIEELQTNQKMHSLLKAHQLFQTSKTMFKLLFGDKEVDCSPNFRLILSCTSESDKMPLTITSLVHCIQVSLSRELMYEIFLNHFMMKEKSQIEDSLCHINKEIMDETILTNTLEEQLLDAFIDNNCFNNISSIKTLVSKQKLLTEADYSLCRAQEVYRTVKKSREVYSCIAQQATVVFQVSAVMKNINPLYQISIEQFLSYFNVAIKQSDRNAVSVVADNVLSFVSYVLLKAKMEVDRPLFALFTALEVEDCNGRVCYGDREFLISPRYGAVLKQSILETENSSSSIAPKSSVKKLFDWMSDEQYQNLLNLSQNFDWFSEAFEKMAKDGREMQWRQISEHDTPELLALPDGLDEKYSPLQRFMVIRAFRSDRIMQAANTFVAMLLGKKFASDPILDLGFILLHSYPMVPIVMLYEKDSILCSMLVKELAFHKQVELVTHYVTDDGAEDIIDALLSNAMRKGYWLHLVDVHHKRSLFKSIFLSMKNYRADVGFIIWLSVDISHNVPVEFLHSCLPVLVDAPKQNLHKSLVHNLNLIPEDIWKLGARSDCMVLIHNICMLHSCLLHRRTCEGLAVNHPDEFEFDISKLLEALDLLHNVIQSENIEVSSPLVRSVQWSKVRDLLFKIVYGREITNKVDLTAVNSLIDFWLGSNASRKDFEIRRARYKLPSILFNTNVKPSTIIQTIEGTQSSMYDSTEFAGIFHITEVATTATSYCLSNLKLLYDEMVTSGSLLHLDSSYLYTRSIDVSQLVTFDQTLNMFSYDILLHSKKIELKEILNSVASKLPRLWSKEFVSECIRKTGGVTNYNMWLLAETDAICVLHHTIKTSVQKLEDLLNVSSTYFNIGKDLIEDALDLYNGKVPKRWHENAGPSAPPQSWTIVSWINDFQSRCGHVEKVLMLGRDKVAGYWLAAFFNPKRLLSIIVQESVQKMQASDVMSDLVVKTEITGRDKDHLRDPPSEGIFVYGIHLWGTHWEKASNDLHDVPPKSAGYALPVIHFQLIPLSEKGTYYTCPCYFSTQKTEESILGIDIEQKEASNLKHALRGVSCTLRPF